MKIKNKWLLAAAAVIIIAITWLDNGFSAYQQLSPTDLAPVIIITVIIFLGKAGVLSAILIGLKKLWEHIPKK